MQSKRIILLTTLVLLVLSACNRVGDGDINIPMAPIALDKNILLIEFTGLNCVNCPTAAEEAHRLLKTYPNNVVVVEMHPKANPYTKAQPDFDYTCEAADRYYAQFGGTSATPFPTGVIAFEPINGEYFQRYQTWEKGLLSVVSQLSNEPVAETRYWLVEDHVIGPQMMPSTGQYDMNYEHNHLLRAEISAEQAREWPANAAQIAPKAKVENVTIVAVDFDGAGRFVGCR